MIPVLLATIPAAMWSGNIIVHCVPPARLALDREATTVPGTEYSSAQRKLFRLSIYFLLVLLPVSICAAVLVR